MKKSIKQLIESDTKVSRITEQVSNYNNESSKCGECGHNTKEGCTNTLPGTNPKGECTHFKTVDEFDSGGGVVAVVSPGGSMTTAMSNNY